MRLNHEDISFLKLLQRSTDRGNGWRDYSRATEPLVKRFNDRHQELLEIRWIERGCRLTERGKIVMEYLV